MSRQSEQFPECVTNYIAEVVRKIRYRRKVRREVRQELVDHFADGLAECKNQEEKQQQAETMIVKFGEARVLAKLIRRGKKRCRPWWQKAWSRTVQVILGIYVLCLFYNAWVMYTWRSSDADYLEQLNQLYQPTTTNQENALPYYVKAAELYREANAKTGYVEGYVFSDEEEQSKPLVFKNLTKEQKQTLKDWVAEYETAWQVAGKGTQLNRYWQVIAPKPTVLPEDVFNVPILPSVPFELSQISNDLGCFRGLAKVARWRAWIYADESKMKEAGQEVVRIIKMGRHLMAGKLLTEYLVGVAIVSLGDQLILEILKDYEPDGEFLSAIQLELEQAFTGDFPFFDIRGESLIYLASQKSNWDQMHGNIMAWVIPVSPFMVGSLPQMEKSTYDFYADFDDRSPYEKHIRPIQNNLPKFPVQHNLMLGILEPALSRSTELTYRVKVTHEAILTILALHRWKQDKGVYPDQLQELINSQYLKELPDDPYSDGVLRYERRGDDFILYSVGADFDDDGGTENPENRWGDSGGNEERDGDHVFWPIEMEN